MEISTSAIELIKKHEGCRLETYLCPAGVATIGYGHTKSTKQDMKISLDRAEELLKLDIEQVEKFINKQALNISQNQFDALVSFGFNVGIGAVKSSTILKTIRLNPNNIRIRNEFMRWVHVRGQVLAGLRRRREEEAELYFTL